MRRKIVFPPVENANEDGLVAVGGDLEIDTLIEAYSKGIFPWPVTSYPINAHFPHTWFSPDPRGVLEFCELHVSKSFIKFLKKSPYLVTFNQAFSDVILNCARSPRKDRAGTWITPDITLAYNNLFHAGHAYSVEVWHEKVLVGGLYGVVLGTFVSGESMFTLEDNAGKVALYTLIHHLETKGVSWIDTQMVTEVVKQFGGKYIPRSVFLSMLSKTDRTKGREELF
jgi:leucyl/phenylalanyl-tRNA--protein transferase